MNLSECVHLVKGLDPVADAFAGTVRSDVVKLSEYGHVTFIIFCGVGVTGTSVVTVNACPDATPSVRSAIPFHYREITSGDTPGALTAAAAAGFTTTAGSSKIVEVEVDAQALAQDGNDYEWVELTLTESVDSPVLGGILIALSEPRYAEHPMHTAIA